MDKFLQEYIERYRRAPRRIEIAARFVADRLGGQNILIFGAGSHTKALLAELPKQANPPRVVGLIDRNVRGSLWGIPVFSPVEIGAQVVLADGIVLSHHEFEHSMRADLEIHGVKTPVLGLYTNEEFFDSAIAQWAGKVPSVPDKKRLLVVQVGERHIASPLVFQSLGSHWFSLYCNVSRLRAPEIASCFDDAIECDQSFSLLKKVVEQYAPHLVYVYDHYTQGNFTGVYLKQRYPEIRVVSEFYDLLHFMFDDPEIITRELYYSREEVDLILYGEREAKKTLDGIVTKEMGPEIDAFFKDANVLRYGQYVPESLCRFVPKQAPGRDLVYAGSINHSSTSSVLFGDNHLLPVFEQLTSLGFTVHVYLNVEDAQAIEQNYTEYVELAKATGRLRLHPKLPLPALIEEISRFDYGLALGGFSPPCRAANQIRIATSVPAKLYTYLAAGLPVLINELEAAGRFLEDHGVGLRLADIRETARLSTEKYLWMKGRVAAVQSTTTSERMSLRLLEFMIETTHDAFEKGFLS